MNKEQKNDELKTMLDTLSQINFEDSDWTGKIKALVAQIQAYLDFSGFESKTKKAYKGELSNITFHGSLVDLYSHSYRNAAPITDVEKKHYFEKGKEDLGAFISKLLEQLKYE